MEQINETILNAEVQMTNISSTNTNTVTSFGVSHIGGIYGFVKYSTTNTINCKVRTTNIQGYNKDAVYMGGLVGYFTDSNSVITDSYIKDSNLSATTQSKDSVVGGVIGFSVRSNITLFDTDVSNLFMYSFSVGPVYCSSFIGAVAAYTQDLILIQNSDVYSINMLYSGSPLYINFLVYYQIRFLVNIKTEVINSQSSGFSTMNGVPVTNCQQKIRNDGVTYYINNDGC
ncbi:Hypothetical_protein [Hexamita inflata]|uniref:Hypothetical_protein n=1 Tax=Hexamita inflata TaxID=28002 RepID=A0ABP1HLX0_9EUKA